MRSFFMNKITYNNIVDKNKNITGKSKNALGAFIGGGCVAILGQGIFDIYFHLFNMDEKNSLTLMLVTIILVSAILTGIGIFDKIAQCLGAGSFIPISGFSNALTSAALESKSEGLILGIGSNMFKLAGSVITYGIVSAYILGILKYLFYLIGVTL